MRSSRIHGAIKSILYKLSERLLTARCRSSFSGSSSAQELRASILRIALSPSKFTSASRATSRFLRPNYARAVVDVIRAKGGKPFLTDCNTLYPGRRKERAGAPRRRRGKRILRRLHRLPDHHCGRAQGPRREARSADRHQARQASEDRPGDHGRGYRRVAQPL